MKKNTEEEVSPINSIDATRQIFVERLGGRRRKAGLTQVALAHKSGVSLRAISNYEAGDLPTLDSLFKLANTLQVKPAWLIGENVEEGVLIDERARLYQHMGTETLIKSLADVTAKLSKLGKEDRRPLIHNLRIIFEEIDRRERKEKAASVDEVASRAAQRAIGDVRSPGVAYGRRGPRGPRPARR